MRLFGFEIGQAYRRPPGKPSSISTFRGPTSLDYELLGEPEAFGAPIVYDCVSRISNTLASLPRKVRRESTNAEVRSPFWVENPNSYQGGNDFIKAIVTSLLLWGEAFVIPARGPRGDTVAAAVLNPQYVWHHVQGQAVIWSINGENYMGEMIHMRNATLPGRVRGYSAAATMELLTRTNRMAQKFIFKVLEQGGAYQLAVELPEGMDATDSPAQNLLMSIIARHSGPDGAYLPLVLPGGVKVTPINQSNADGKILDLSDQTAKELAARWFHLDDSLMGFKSNQPQIYQNQPGVWYRYWMFACKHLHGEIEQGLSRLLPPGQRYSLEEWDTLLGGPHDRAKLALEMAKVNQAMGVKVYIEDELRAVTGMYPLDEYEEMGAGEAPEPEPPDELAMAATAAEIVMANGDGGDG